ncbi:MAG: hypothetical protein IJ449_10270 [Clostridia bacterium]|nr:hypothetical protein [Clostridia bacterium]
MSIEASVMTVWRYRSEDDAGCAVYDTDTATAYAVYLAKTDGRTSGGSGYAGSLAGGGEQVSGFLLPLRSTDGEETPILLSPGYDWLGAGDLSSYETPVAAATAGCRVFCVTSAVQPPHISDGTLVDWCCFEAERRVP